MKRRDAPQDRGRAIGAILVEQGRLNAQDVDDIQRFASAHGVRFGEAAVQMKRISEHDIESALAQQYNYPVLARGGVGGVADDVIAALDAHAGRLGLSRSEYVRRRLAQDAATPGSPVSVADLTRFASTFADLADPDVMSQAWT